jgi:hypothetical protein
VDQSETNKEVDRFFSAAGGDQTAQEELGMLRQDANIFLPLDYHRSAERALNAEQQHLSDDEYKAFAKNAANDPRLQEHLPQLSVSILSNRDKIDSDKDGVISRAEVRSAANDGEKFDPVQRKALQFVEDNFDVFGGRPIDVVSQSFPDGKITRSQIKSTGISGITEKDLRDARRETDFLAGSRHQIHANRILLNNFKSIDADGSGSITNSEGMRWFKEHYGSQPRSIEKRFVSRALPQTDNQGDNLRSEVLNRESLTTRIDEISANASRLRNHWNGGR